MYRLLEFLRSVYVFVLFVLFELGAIGYYAHSNSYTEAKIVGTAAHFTAKIGEMGSFVSDYFSLKGENEVLQNRIVALEQELSRYQNNHSDSLLMSHSRIDEVGREYIAAKIIINSINKQRNYLVINRGLNSGVKKGMAVISLEGAIVGVVEHASSNYSTVTSVLNLNFRTSGQLKVGSQAGAISWDGTDRYSVTMSELSKYAEPFVGAEVVTTTFSQLFPENLLIGHVTDIKMNEAQTSYKLKVDLANDFSALKKVFVISDIDFSQKQYMLDILEEHEKSFE